MTLYNCEIKGSGAALDAYLNEYHLYASPGASHSYSTNLRAWMEKANLFTIKLAHSAKAKAGEPVQFSVTAGAVTAGQRRLLCQMSFPAGISAPDIPAVPFSTPGKKLAEGNSLHFMCEEPGTIVEKPWQADRRLIQKPAEIYQLYAEIQNFFVAGNVDALMKLSRARIAFGAKLYGKTPPDYEQMVYKNLAATLGSRPRWKTIAHPEQQLTVHEFLPAKVVRVLDLHGNPPLRTLADQNGLQFGYDIILAMTGEGLVWIM